MILNNISDVPVLLLIFNRQEVTKKVFDEIRKASPKKLFIAADGPRENHKNDNENCRLTRQICDNVNWECDVITRYSDINQGCKIAVSTAITWFFEYVEAGIILEDDCLPSYDFFNFCMEMLSKYKDNPKVMQISGSNYLGEKYHPNADYYFSGLNDIWGWATWRRAWQKFDLDMNGYKEFREAGGIRNYLKDRHMSNWLTIYLDDALNKDASVWSSQWTYTILKNNGLTIVPSKNLVENIGFEEQGTHSANRSWQLYNNFPIQHLKVGKHPKLVQRDMVADRIRFQVIKITDPRCFLFSRIKAFLYGEYRKIKKFIYQVVDDKRAIIK